MQSLDGWTWFFAWFDLMMLRFSELQYVIRKFLNMRRSIVLLIGFGYNASSHMWWSELQVHARLWLTTNNFIVWNEIHVHIWMLKDRNMVWRSLGQKNSWSDRGKYFPESLEYYGWISPLSVSFEKWQDCDTLREESSIFLWSKRGINCSKLLV